MACGTAQLAIVRHRIFRLFDQEKLMRILALEVEKPEASAAAFRPLLIEEAKEVWKFYQEDFIRDIYFRADGTSAVLMLECRDVDEAKQKLSELPLVSAGSNENFETCSKSAPAKERAKFWRLPMISPL